MTSRQPEPWRVKVVHKDPASLQGVRIVYQAPVLRHFTARFDML